MPDSQRLRFLADKTAMQSLGVGWVRTCERISVSVRSGSGGGTTGRGWKWTEKRLSEWCFEERWQLTPMARLEQIFCFIDLRCQIWRSTCRRSINYPSCLVCFFSPLSSYTPHSKAAKAGALHSMQNMYVEGANSGLQMVTDLTENTVPNQSQVHNTDLIAHLCFVTQQKKKDKMLL